MRDIFGDIEVDKDEAWGITHLPRGIPYSHAFTQVNIPRSPYPLKIHRQKYKTKCAQSRKLFNGEIMTFLFSSPIQLGLKPP